MKNLSYVTVLWKNVIILFLEEETETETDRDRDGDSWFDSKCPLSLLPLNPCWGSPYLKCYRENRKA